MSKRILKRYFSVVLLFVLTFTVFPLHSPFVYAAETPAAASASDILANNQTSQDALQANAEKNARTLTSLYGVDSVSYALIDNGNIVLSNKYTKSSHKTEVPSADIYGIGSISKMFTTTAVLQLAEQGKITLDTPVVTYLPEFTMADERYKNITVRMLLNHSSGLMGSSLGNSLLLQDTDTISHDSFLNQLKSQRLKADPGAFSVYCNDGFTLAEILIEKVTGISFSEYVRKNISTPLNLTKTATPADDISASLLAGTYAKLLSSPLPKESFQVIGAGGMYSSAKDLCSFAQIFMSSGSNPSVLSSSNAAVTKYPEYSRGLWPVNGSALSYGLGWDTVNTSTFDEYGIKALTKGGDTLLYHGSLIVLPEENMAVAVLSSGGTSSYDEVMGENILLDALKAKGRIDTIKPSVTFKVPKKTALPNELKQYEGYYGNVGNTMQITMKEDGLLTIKSLLAPSSPAQIFYYTGDGKFYYTDGSYYITFEKTANGNTYIYHSGYVNLPGIGQMKTSGYLGEKLNDNPISTELEKIWQKRSGKTYFMVSEKYSSENYLMSGPFAKLLMPEGIKGYWMNTAIADENTAKTTLTIPDNYGRDLSDYTFYKEGNIEYVKMNSGVFVSSDSVKPLSAANKKYTVGGKGYAVWYSINQKNVSGKVSITVPKNAAYALYDDNNTCLAYSYVKNNKTVTLPKKGYIVFVGDAGSTFQVKFVK
ncbi:serine hydrolase domain-containing protein [Anaerocolumna xylanovorans]|uniref:CubicO group peptidase, beta-lactamase class C family n=1 Tax=Anaerocolumna xylanovorans DSM 12503 TaxID=1121345 RepID=A0A1M7Y199_9FIRM|nr:serine hydrolase domain-containing protein [Anaerocolumna xylanovorans]SHO45547.1 CubicO group peptidase, beta-lactamase class C family [Anaerocolumna xylanovorans DSM 12503]